MNCYKYNLRGTVYFNAGVALEDYYQHLLRQVKDRPEDFINDDTRKRELKNL